MDKNKVKLITVFRYRTARVDNPFLVLPHSLVHDLENELASQAAITLPDNHVVYCFRDIGWYADETWQGKEIYLMITDRYALFGYSVKPFK